MKSEPQEPEVRMEYTPKRMGEPVDEEATADSEYYPSPELAMKNSDFQVDDEDAYQKNIDEVIAKFENEEYAAIYFRSIKDKNTECFTFTRFKKKVIEGEEKYVYSIYYRLSDGDEGVFCSCPMALNSVSSRRSDGERKKSAEGRRETN